MTMSLMKNVRASSSPTPYSVLYTINGMDNWKRSFSILEAKTHPLASIYKGYEIKISNVSDENRFQAHLSDFRGGTGDV